MTDSLLPQGWLETASRSRGPIKLYSCETNPEPSFSRKSVPIVLLHGLCTGSGEWEPVMEVMGSTHKIYAMDLPGHCQTPTVDEDFSLPTITRDVLYTIDELGIDECVVVGHSLGARIAVPVALHLGQRCCGLVIEDIDMIPRIGGLEPAEMERCRNFESVHKDKEGVYIELQKFGYDRAVIDELFVAKSIWQEERDNERVWKIGISPLVSKLEYHGILAAEDCETMFGSLRTGASRRPVALVKAEDNSALSQWGLRLMRHMVPDSILVNIPGSDYVVHKSKTHEFCDFLTKFSAYKGRGDGITG